MSEVSGGVVNYSIWNGRLGRLGRLGLGLPLQKPGPQALQSRHYGLAWPGLVDVPASGLDGLRPGLASH